MLPACDPKTDSVERDLVIMGRQHVSAPA